MGNDGKRARNPFEDILQDEKLPIEIKKKVMSDIVIIKCFIDMTDLFMVKHPNLIIDAFFRNTEDEQENDENGDSKNKNKH